MSNLSRQEFNPRSFYSQTVKKQTKKRNLMLNAEEKSAPVFVAPSVLNSSSKKKTSMRIRPKFEELGLRTWGGLGY